MSLNEPLTVMEPFSSIAALEMEHAVDHRVLVGDRDAQRVIGVDAQVVVGQRDGDRVGVGGRDSRRVIQVLVDGRERAVHRVTVAGDDWPLPQLIITVCVSSEPMSLNEPLTVMEPFSSIAALERSTLSITGFLLATVTLSESSVSTPMSSSVNVMVIV